MIAAYEMESDMTGTNNDPMTSASPAVISDRKVMASRRRKATLLMSATVLSCGIASDSFARAGKPPVAKDSIVASLTLKDGGYVQFNEVAPGELVVLAQSPGDMGRTGSASTVAGVSIHELSRLDAVGQYKAFSRGAAPPAALLQAQQRVKAAAQKKLPQLLIHGTKVQKQDARVATGTVAPADGAWFQSNYCPRSGYSFNYCLLYRTGGGTTEQNASFIQSTVNPYRGNITHKLEYKDCFLFVCSWTTSITWGVQENYVGWISQSGSNRGRRITVFDAVGDGYNRAAFGY
jgi:hypothetical protein